MKSVYTLLLVALFSIASEAQWSEQTSGVTSFLYSVSAVNNNTVWICGATGKVLLTTNGGTNWVITSTPNAALALYNIWGIDSTDALVTGSSTTTYVYRTTNAGANWTQVFSESGGFIDAINGLSLVNPDAIFMYGDPVGSRWSLWQSTDEGATWDSTGWYLPQAGTETGYNNSMYVYRAPYTNVKIWFGTNNTRIYKFNASQHGVSQPTTGQVNSLAILLMDTLNGVAGGSTGMLFTSDGGANWINSTTIPGTGSINGFAVGNSYGELYYTRGTSVYHTTNSGVNWVAATTQSGTYTHMQKARADGDFNIWAIRNNGGISKYTYPIGIKRISSEVPNSYVLHQNYPNPFNPVTKITFDIPKSSFTEIKVYDNLGREVATLISQQLKPGSYETEWNASNYPSGVYYYKLVSSDFSTTKKMVLVK